MPTIIINCLKLEMMPYDQALPDLNEVFRVSALEFRVSMYHVFFLAYPLLGDLPYHTTNHSKQEKHENMYHHFSSMLNSTLLAYKPTKHSRNSNLMIRSFDIKSGCSTVFAHCFFSFSKTKKRTHDARRALVI